MKPTIRRTTDHERAPPIWILGVYTGIFKEAPSPKICHDFSNGFTRQNLMLLYETASMLHSCSDKNRCCTLVFKKNIGLLLQRFLASRGQTAIVENYCRKVRRIRNINPGATISSLQSQRRMSHLAFSILNCQFLFYGTFNLVNHRICNNSSIADLYSDSWTTYVNLNVIAKIICSIAVTDVAVRAIAVIGCW